MLKYIPNFAFVQQIFQISKLNFHIFISLSNVKFLIVTKMYPLAYSKLQKRVVSFEAKKGKLNAMYVTLLNIFFFFSN